MTIDASDTSRFPTSRALIFSGLAPLVGVVFLGFLAVGMPLAALSLEVHDHLGFPPLVVGCVLGIQSIVTVLTRHTAGTLSDHKGPRRAVLLGLPLATLSGVFYLASDLLPFGPTGSLVLILLGRVVMGLGESFFITGTMSWGMGRLGPKHTSKVMSWQGIAMYGALGIGAPLGLAVQRGFGFSGVALLTIATPLVACLIAVPLAAVQGSGAGVRVPFHRVLGLIWRPGVVLLLATAPFATMAAFLALDFRAHGWSGAGFGLGSFAAGYVLIRLLFSHLPDRLGGARVATVSLLVEALGQVVLWLAPNAASAFAGASLTGLGFSLVFPAMGVEATRSVTPAERGRAVGNFIGFFDLAIGLTSPLVGLVAGRFGYDSGFLVGALATLAALALLPGVRRMASAA